VAEQEEMVLFISVVGICSLHSRRNMKATEDLMQMFD